MYLHNWILYSNEKYRILLHKDNINEFHNVEWTIPFKFKTRQNKYVVIRGQNSGYLWGRSIDCWEDIWGRLWGLEIHHILMVITICKSSRGYIVKILLVILLKINSSLYIISKVYLHTHIIIMYKIIQLSRNSCSSPTDYSWL